MRWVIWAILLMAQQFFHGLSSRAKNSNSYLYNLLAAIFSNGVWICSNFIMVGNIVEAAKRGNLNEAVGIVVFYTFFCVAGSLLSQWAAINYFERKGNKWDLTRLASARLRKGRLKEWMRERNWRNHLSRRTAGNDSSSLLVCSEIQRRVRRSGTSRSSDPCSSDGSPCLPEGPSNTR